MKNIMKISLSLSLFASMIATCLVAISETIPPGNGTGFGIGALTAILAFLVTVLIREEY